MAQKPKRQFRVVLQRSSLLTKIVVLSSLTVTTVALLILAGGIRQARRVEAQHRAEAAQLERDNAELNQDIQQSGSIENHKKLAEEELGLVDPNTVIFTPEN